MTIGYFLKKLEDTGIRLSLQEGRLYCEASRSTVPPEIQSGLASRKEEIRAFLERDEKQRKRKWIMTPAGPAKIWNFLAGDRVGVVLKSDIDSCPEGLRPIRFIGSKDIRPVESLAELDQEPHDRKPGQQSGLSGRGASR